MILSFCCSSLLILSFCMEYSIILPTRVLSFCTTDTIILRTTDSIKNDILSFCMQPTIILCTLLLSFLRTRNGNENLHFNDAWCVVFFECHYHHIFPIGNSHGIGLRRRCPHILDSSTAVSLTMALRRRRILCCTSCTWRQKISPPGHNM